MPVTVMLFMPEMANMLKVHTAFVTTVTISGRLLWSIARCLQMTKNTIGLKCANLYGRTLKIHLER